MNNQISGIGNWNFLVTGTAGFIGFSLAKKLLESGYSVVGVDNLNSYYSKELKNDRNKILLSYDKYKFVEGDISTKEFVDQLFAEFKPNMIVNLAAQAGVRYSIDNPFAYVQSNLVGFLNLLEACRIHPVRHFIYASSSSVYGGNKVAPFSTNHNTDHPLSLYATTKKTNELMAHTYSHLFNIPTTGLRFFTVYGPWGRPDMAYFSFTRNIINGTPIKVFNNGEMERDFTYIDDIVNGIIGVINRSPQQNPNWNEASDSISNSFAPYKVYNIGNNKPVKLMDFINILENKIGKKAKIEYLSMQPGDVLRTYADIDDIRQDTDFSPSTDLSEGLERFVDWYMDYYKVK